MAILRFNPSPDEEMSPEELSILLTSMMPEIPGYRVMRRIGKGGMSFVYLAVQESLDRQVAIKITAPDVLRDETSKQRFEQEARTIAKLEHPSIVGIYEVGRSPQGLMYYVMPFLSKGHLGQRDLRHDELRIVTVLRSLLSALGYAHTRGIVHRDVKAENVLFDNADRPVLADFGIALPFRSATRITTIGFAVGSAAYMAPEQARGEIVDGRADLYAVGVLAYEMLTGHLPFQANDALALAVMHAHDPIPPLPGNRRHWQPFISCALAKSREQRFRNAEQMLNALDELEHRLKKNVSPANQGSVADLATPLITEALPRRHQRVWLIGFGIAATILVALATGIWWASPERPPDFLSIDDGLPMIVDPDPIAAIAVTAGAAPSGPEKVAAITTGEFLSAPLAYDPRVPAARELLAAQRQIARLRLSAPPNDNASESLLAARALAPLDPQLPRLETALITAFGSQIERALVNDDHETAALLWQRVRRFVEQADLTQGEAWTTLLRQREGAVRTMLSGATQNRDRRLLQRARNDIRLYGLDAPRFEAEIRAARLALLPRQGERIEGSGTPMRLIVAPSETRPGLAAMESEVSRDDFLAFAQATERPPSRCRGGFLERRTWIEPGFTQTPHDPIVCVTAADAEAYAQWRNQNDGLRYRLPTTAEWAKLSQGAASSCTATRLACDGREGSRPTGSGQASPLGLRDVGGNVREWLSGGRIGGAGWRTPQTRAQAATTQAEGDERGQDDLGFRLVRDVSLDELLGTSPPARTR